MAMTALVKSELATIKVTKPCDRKSEVAATLRFAGGLHIVSGRIVIEAELDTGAAARRLRTDISEVFGHPSELVIVNGSGIRRGTGAPNWPDRLARPTSPRSASPGGQRWPVRLRGGLARSIPGTWIAD